jgi:molybdopterin molybdotransferase
MISVNEASHLILSHLFNGAIVTSTLEECVGKVLAEPVYADRDFPPFDRVTMDGIAILFERFKSGQRSFQITGTHAAGDKNLVLSDWTKCLEVMTGAVLPVGTDTVIRYEDISISNGVATINVNNIERAQSIHVRGQDARQGELLLSPGMVLSPAEIALLASVGKSSVAIRSFPKTAIISSGDELVETDQQPLPHQIRRSNNYAIQAAMKSMGWDGANYHLPDEKNILFTEIKSILEKNDVLILSGGVSKGKFDFIPDVLEELGVKKIFHQVSQRPGKPFWFGVSNEGKIVFALPGNPVSTFMCFHRYVKPWIQKSLGIKPRDQFAVLATDFSFAPKLTYFLQVGVINENGKLMAYPNAGGGSGDFANLKDIDGFLELPLDKTDFKAGEVFPLFQFRS